MEEIRGNYNKQFQLPEARKINKYKSTYNIGTNYLKNRTKTKAEKEISHEKIDKMKDFKSNYIKKNFTKTKSIDFSVKSFKSFY